ncbi:MAG: EamA family transporter [Anaerolineaceae bacterium]|nr:EamA family transporter [Anaerolineaceae bacterium]
MLSTNLPGIVLALTAAFAWGSGDFAGGYATRRSNQYYVLALSSFSGLVMAVIAAFLWRERFPALQGILFAMTAGVSGGLGIAALYRALSIGRAASVAPTSGVIGAALPVIFTALTQGLPAPLKLVGFGLAFAGIWLVSAAHSDDKNGLAHQGFVLACLAGVGFSGFFILLGLVEPGKIFTPVILARFTATCTALVLIKIKRLPLPKLTTNPVALLAGVLDAGGNLFYILSKQLIRLDIVVVIASLYPAATVFLSGVILKEKVSRSQWLGVLICLAAIILITI